MTRLVARNGRIEKESTVPKRRYVWMRDEDGNLSWERVEDIFTGDIKEPATEPVPHSLTPALEAVLAELKRQTELMEKISSVLSRLADILDKVSDVKRQ